ncbi:ArnT family glycosyltransferase [Dictyobacter kobayashii]|uniref:ArnT family glycosyltransferase n=1 Tax=Dictyobacter kobayashii TaxID=2014872 RepID=UPI0013872309|nr:glycosyltransferase family 39 protein [Dictyobacter kobayashii]
MIVIVAAFLRFYQLNTTEFDDDQGVIFHMARYAVTHGLIPATTNRASIGIINPPATIYLLMIPAAVSSDPLAGVFMTAFLMVVSVLLTYLFVRRYYGRVAATIAALSYATLFRAVVYSRFMWDQNFLPFFIVLFFMALFSGIIDRKKGWFLSALILLGILVQLHASTILLLVPLALAYIFAPGTIRKRDYLFGGLALFLLYFPYFANEVKIHFSDIIAYLHAPKKTVLDMEALQFYQAFLNPYKLLSEQYPLHWRVVPFIGQPSLLWQLSPYLSWSSILLELLIVISMVALLVLAFKPASRGTAGQESRTGLWGKALFYWNQLRGSPYRCALLVLLAWQIVPLLYLMRHSMQLYLHYIIFFMPGPFILLGIFIRQVIIWFEARSSRVLKHTVTYGLYTLILLIVLAQCIGTTAGVLDLDQGHYSDGAPVNNFYNDLRSLRNAVTAADQLALENHISRVYISADWPTQSALGFLSTQMHTPVTLFQDNGCAALPASNAGPAVLLMGPYPSFADTLVQRFTTATLVSKPARAGGSPFRLYIINTKAAPSASTNRLGQDLQWLGMAGGLVQYKQSSWQVSQWTLLRSAQPDYRTVYSYTLTQSIDGQNVKQECAFSALHAGDQILVPFQQKKAAQVSSKGAGLASTMDIQAASYQVQPYTFQVGPLKFLTFEDIDTPVRQLTTPAGKNALAIPTASLASPKKGK